MNISEIFLNSQNKLRSGWRFIAFLLAFFFISTLLGQIISKTFASLAVDFAGNTVLSFIFPNFVLLSGALCAGWLCNKFLEKLPFRALGASLTNHWWKHLAYGLIAGFVSILFAASIGVIFGGLRFELNQNYNLAEIARTAAISLGVFTVGAAAEETFFRGYMLQTFVRADLAWLAIAFTSIFFAAVHLGNPGADFISTLNTALAGLWFGTAYLKTKDLWFVFGLHLMWNWVQGAFLGLPVSGITELTAASYLRVANFGVKVVSGGDYGIEGGLACTIAIVASGVVIWYLPLLKPSGEMRALTSETTARRIASE